VVFIYNGILFSHRKKEISLLAGKWTKLENIILSEVWQAQKAKAACFLSYMGYEPDTNINNIMKNKSYQGKVTYERGSVKEGS
jgi:hypothetical protein